MKYLVALWLALIGQFTYGQSLPDFTQIPLSQASDYESAESSVLQASNYILSTPFEKNDQTRLNGGRFILKWMAGTPHYNFSFGTVATKTMKDDPDLLILYVSAMSKYSLENPVAAKSPDSVGLHAITMELTYCNNPTNNMKMTKPMKKLWEAMQEGKLLEALQ